MQAKQGVQKLICKIEGIDNRFTWLLLWSIVGCFPAVKADETSLRVQMTGVESITGSLVPVAEVGCVGIQSPFLKQPYAIPASRLLEAQPANPIDTTIAISAWTHGQDRYAVDLMTGDRLVGKILESDEGMIHLQTAAGRKLSVNIDDLAAAYAVSQAPQWLHSLATARHRLSLDDGWSIVDDGTLRTRVPGAAVVARLDLPQRFRLAMTVRCDGRADFELTLGDVAGQGAQRQDRFGGSVSRLPSERLVTRLEWFGDHAIVLRSNASVSDSTVFPAATDTLTLDLYVDQVAGSLIAFNQGQQVGQAVLTDSEPLQRRDLTLISRGDAVSVERFEVYRWDGKVPESKSLSDAYTLLRDGTVIPAAVRRWRGSVIEVGGDQFPDAKLLETSYGRSSKETKGLCFRFADGSELWGMPMGDAKTWRINSAEGIFAFDPSSVVAIRSRKVDTPNVDANRAVLSADGIRLNGTLVSSEADSAFAWRSVSSGQTLEIVDDSDVSIRWRQREQELVRATVEQLELTNGDRVPGEAIQIDQNGVQWNSAYFGNVTVPNDRMTRIQLRAMKSEPGDELLALVLRLPRRQKQAPPRHLVFSVTGDVLRGDLLSMDATEARIVVRDRTWKISRESIAEIVWLAANADKPKDCRYVIATNDGARLGFDSATLADDELIVQHEAMGQGRVPKPSWSTLQFGSREAEPRSRWKLTPVKEPRTFDEP